MFIKGLTKLSLVDYPNHLCCIIFTGGCNFRCPFCHNSALVTHLDDNYIEEEDVLEFLKQRRNILDSVVVTGGEPLLHDLKSFLRSIKELGYLIKLDTNGSHPDKLRELIELKLINYVALDIKNDFSSYDEAIGIKNFDIEKVKRTLCLLNELNVEYEVRTTIVKEIHNEKNIEKIVKLLPKSAKYYLQMFIPNENTIEKGLTSPSKSDMENYKNIAKTYIENTTIRDSF